MSHVTDTILTFGILEEELEAIRSVNEWLEPQSFVLTSAHANQAEISGGSKALQSNIALAAFNYRSDEELVAAVRQYAWEFPAEVHLFVKRENDESGFSELRWRRL